MPVRSASRPMPVSPRQTPTVIMTAVRFFLNPLVVANAPPAPAELRHGHRRWGRLAWCRLGLPCAVGRGHLGCVPVEEVVARLGLAFHFAAASKVRRLEGAGPRPATSGSRKRWIE